MATEGNPSGSEWRVRPCPLDHPHPPPPTEDGFAYACFSRGIDYDRLADAILAARPTYQTLPQFLSARIAEDEGAAEAKGSWWLDGFVDGKAVKAWRPMVERDRRENAAKRRILADHRIDGDTCVMCQWQDVRGCPTLRHLAAVYADHPDYRQEWKP